jgi:hypothetical protein
MAASRSTLLYPAHRSATQRTPADVNDSSTDASTVSAASLTMLRR